MTSSTESSVAAGNSASTTLSEGSGNNVGYGMTCQGVEHDEITVCTWRAKTTRCMRIKSSKQ